MTWSLCDSDSVRLLHNDCYNLIIKKVFNVFLQKKKTWPKVRDWLLDLMQLMGSPRLIQLSSRLYAGFWLSLWVRIGSERGTLHLCWKLRKGNVVPSLNHMEVKSCVDGLTVIPNWLFWYQNSTLISSQVLQNQTSYSNNKPSNSDTNRLVWY